MIISNNKYLKNQPMGCVANVKKRTSINIHGLCVHETEIVIKSPTTGITHENWLDILDGPPIGFRRTTVSVNLSWDQKSMTVRATDTEIKD